MKKQNLGFLTVGLVVGLLIGGLYSQQSAIAANGQGRGKLVSVTTDDESYIYRAWENGDVEVRKGVLASLQAKKGVSEWIPLP